MQAIGATDATSSYPLMEDADVGLVYSSTVGLELALLGTPVLPGARAHYAGKGFTVDADDGDHYLELLDQVLADPEPFAPPVDDARRYANLLFFEAGLPQPPANEPVGGLVRLDTVCADDLLPGRSASLDVICRGILEGEPFRLPSLG